MSRARWSRAVARPYARSLGRLGSGHELAVGLVVVEMVRFDGSLPATGDYRVKVTESQMGSAWKGPVDVVVVIY